MTYTERGGSTVFVVGGDGLSLYNENEYLYAYSEGILVTSTARHRLAKHKTGQQLKNAKTPDGKPIVASGQMTDKEADQAVRIFLELRRAHGENKKKELRLRGVSIATEDPDPSTGVEDDQLETLAAQSDILENDEDMALLLKYSRPVSELDSSGAMGVMGWFPSPWEIIKSLGKKIKEIANKVGQTIMRWATELCRAAGGFWKLVVKWAGHAWEFVLDTAKAIGKALVWIFDQVKFGFNAIIELDWSNSIGAFVNAGLDVADDKMANTIRSILLDCLEKFQHGGGLDSFKDRGSSQGLNTTNSNLDGISPFLTEAIDEIKAVINALGELAKTLGNDIWDLIGGKCSFGTLMERVGKDIADFKLTGKDLTLLTLVSLLVRWPAASLHRASLGDKAVAPKWEGHLNKGNFEDLINNRVPWADAALTVKPFFESLQLATSILDAITSFWDYTFDGVGLGAFSTEIGIINGAVAAINILVNLPLPSDRSGVPGIPHHIISYLNGSTAVVDLIFKVLKWKKVMTPVVARRISTTWKVAVGLVIFGNEVFVEGWLITRHGRADRMYVGIQHEVFKLLGAGLSSVSAWTMDSQLEVALAAETLLIAYRNDGVNLTAMNGSSGVVQVMIKGGGNMTQLMMIPDRQWVADISRPKFADLVFEDGLSQEKQLEFPILRKELEFPILKQEVKVEVVEE
ncbi:hypothetical protein CEP51_008452 [Fusarium floridanum]|uniref:Uncharacterized protein n=1 Tax=Fusarium floridanum TaxID=1325733 RepID=A0A428RKV8_9HYPO|nr:hypothetical protein CEP51_008452 [Fusarium floridanum]